MYLFGEGKQLVDRPISVGSKIVESGSFRHAEKHDDPSFDRPNRDTTWRVSLKGTGRRRETTGRKEIYGSMKIVEKNS